MKTSRFAVVVAALASAMFIDSAAQSDASLPKVVIPPRLDAAALPAFDADPFPQEKSKMPKGEEWKTAPVVHLTRHAKRLTDCRAYRLREWMKIHCERPTAGIRLLAGTTDGIAIWVSPPTNDPNTGAQVSAGSSEMIFPVRAGDRRVFEVLDLNFGDWEGFGTSSSMILEEQWMEGAAKPAIALLAR